jgi:citronellol/citronellal dehydrogenase
MRRVQQIVGHLGKSTKLSETQLEAVKVAAKAGCIYDAIAKAKKGNLKGKTLFVTGASRGIGLAIALRAARDGANVVIAAKTATPHPRLPGTIHTAAEEIRKAGGKALPIECDIRYEDQVKAAVEAGVKEFGGIDICINNASAISLTGTADTDMKKYDLMHSINTRGTFVTSRACLPYLKKSKNPHILNISPPLNMEEKWFAPHVAYTMAKFGMSMCALGMAGEFRNDGIAVNTLWPLTTIATAAVQNLLGGDNLVSKSRLPEIMSDAAYTILTSASKQVTGGFFIDESVLRAVGETDFSKYAVVAGTPDSELAADFFV